MNDYEKFLKLHGVYERKAYRIILKEFRGIFRSINFNYLNEYEVSNSIKESDLQEMLFKVHYSIAQDYGKLTYNQLRKLVNKKAFNPITAVQKEIRQYVIQYFSIYGGRQIKLLKKTAVNKVMVELRKSENLGETLIEKRDRILKVVNKPDFYKHEAMRIARTETTVSMNYAEHVSAMSAGPEMDKIWMTRLDGKERSSHMEMNNVKVSQKKTFTVGGYQMLYPGDRTNGAPAEEIINCRCKCTYRPKEDDNGLFILNI